MKYNKKDYQKLLNIIRKDFDIEIFEYKKEWWQTRCYCWNINNQSIKIGIKSDYWYETIATLAHEFGHCQSVLKKKNINKFEMMLYNFGAELNKKQKKNILSEEKRAWKYGFQLLKKIGIKVDKRMLEFKKMCLRSHIIKLTNN